MEPKRKVLIGGRLRRLQLQKDSKTGPREKQNSRAFLESQGRSISGKKGGGETDK